MRPRPQRTMRRPCGAGTAPSWRPTCWRTRATCSRAASRAGAPGPPSPLRCMRRGRGRRAAAGVRASSVAGHVGGRAGARGRPAGDRPDGLRRGRVVCGRLGDWPLHICASPSTICCQRCQHRMPRRAPRRALTHEKCRRVGRAARAAQSGRPAAARPSGGLSVCRARRAQRRLQPHADALRLPGGGAHAVAGAADVHHHVALHAGGRPGPACGARRRLAEVACATGRSCCWQPRHVQCGAGRACSHAARVPARPSLCAAAERYRGLPLLLWDGARLCMCLKACSAHLAVVAAGCPSDRTTRMCGSQTTVTTHKQCRAGSWRGQGAPGPCSACAVRELPALLRL